MQRTAQKTGWVKIKDMQWLFKDAPKLVATAVANTGLNWRPPQLKILTRKRDLKQQTLQHLALWCWKGYPAFPGCVRTIAASFIAQPPTTVNRFQFLD
ncbi:hypothetical protein Y1Q_0023864 [Alligator mississippiensis]|uniref:Uncharacterized protein n=1 Tax=Alligator mississippiensis TaxID=8496 RepID=A0A151MKF7_ALLMI|nr:hypothetical protein Y1Q_0023864 [Alligator mississippiensis]